VSLKKKEIMKNLEDVLPKLDDVGKATLLAYGEGMVAQKQLMEKAEVEKVRK
jgi:hypothetical protein